MSIKKERQDRAVERLLFKIKGLMTICRVFLQRRTAFNQPPALPKKTTGESTLPPPVAKKPGVQ